MDQELVTRAATGDHKAFSVLATNAFEGLFRTARLVLRDDDLAADAVQDALISAWLHIRAVREPERFEAWLRRLLIRACYAQRDRARRHRVIELHVDEAELVTRLSARRVVIDGRSVQREDDAPDTVRHRLEVYRRQTAPLSEWYDSLGLLSRIDASGEVADITERILGAFAPAADVR